MKKTRLTALILAMLMAGSTLVACSTPDEPDDSESTTVSDKETNADELKDDLPAGLNYNKDEIVFISSDLITTDELTGDPVEDVIYERNSAVEQRLNVKITCINDGDAVNKMITAVKSNTADYDVLVGYCWQVAPNFTEGYFADLRQTKACPVCDAPCGKDDRFCHKCGATLE